MPILPRTKTSLFLCLGIIPLAIFSLFFTSKALAQGEIQVTADILNVRSGPGLEYMIVDKVKEGERYTVIEQQKDWYKIRLTSTQMGWIAAEFVNYGAASEETVPNPYNSQPTQPQESLADKALVVESKIMDLNVRSGANAALPVITTINPSEHYPLLQREGEWLQIQINAQETGWVANWLVQLKEIEIAPNQDNGSPTDIGKNNNQLPQTAPAPKVMILSSNTNLREGPGTHFPVVTKGGQGDSFDVLGKDGQWYQVDLQDGRTAFVADWVVSLEENINVDRQGALAYLKNKTIVLDAGHGGKDNGATGSYYKTLEKVVNLQVAQQVKGKLEAAGAKVIMTRNTDHYLTLPERVQISHREQADLFLSIHHNTHDNSETSGTITYYYSAADQQLARIMQREIVRENGLINRNARYENFYVLRENKRPALLIELAFLTNQQDEAASINPSFQERSAMGIVYGAALYFQQKAQGR